MLISINGILLESEYIYRVEKDYDSFHPRIDVHMLSMGKPITLSLWASPENNMEAVAVNSEEYKKAIEILDRMLEFIISHKNPNSTVPTFKHKFYP